MSLVAGACANEPDGVDPVAPAPVTATLPPHEREPSVTELAEGDPAGERNPVSRLRWTPIMTRCETARGWC